MLLLHKTRTSVKNKDIHNYRDITGFYILLKPSSTTIL